LVLAKQSLSIIFEARRYSDYGRNCFSDTGLRLNPSVHCAFGTDKLLNGSVRISKHKMFFSPLSLQTDKRSGTWRCSRSGDFLRDTTAETNRSIEISRVCICQPESQRSPIAVFFFRSRLRVQSLAELLIMAFDFQAFDGSMISASIGTCAGSSPGIPAWRGLAGHVVFGAFGGKRCSTFQLSFAYLCLPGEFKA
jgi:hypothetical protein